MAAMDMGLRCLPQDSGQIAASTAKADAEAARKALADAEAAKQAALARIPDGYTAAETDGDIPF